MTENTLSKYAVVFDKRSYGWTTDLKVCLMFLKHPEAHCNELLQARGWLFLRDVYEKLGLPVTRDSCLVGWIYEEGNKLGDNYVRFDIRDHSEDKESYVIDFNVDGNIIDRI